MDSTKPSSADADGPSRPCPRCAENIKIDQLFCHHCGQQFTVRHLGYCTTCHEQVDVGAGTTCPTCGNDVVDVIVESEALDAPPPTGQTASAPVAQPSAGVAGGPGPQGAAVPIPAARTPNWKRRATISAVIALLASGLMIAASFMPWLGFEDIPTQSGWDLYEFQRDSGSNVFFIRHFLTDSSGHAWPFVTGLATLISGLWLAGWTIVLLALSSLLRRRKSLTQMWAGVMGILSFFAFFPAMMPSLFTVIGYFEPGAASGASLEYGLILFWAATLVGLCASLYASVGPLDEAISRSRSARGRRTP